MKSYKISCLLNKIQSFIEINNKKYLSFVKKSFIIKELIYIFG